MTWRPGVDSHQNHGIFFQPNLLCFVLCNGFRVVRLYITRITINNGTPHLKSPKSQNRGAALGRPAKKLLGGGGGGFN